jgi:hypothetical protein
VPRSNLSLGRTVDRTKPPNIFSVLSDISDHWSPQTIAVLNDYDDRLAKVGGEFSPHSHPETDEFFLVLSGSLTIRMDDSEVTLIRVILSLSPEGEFTSPMPSEMGLVGEAELRC